MVPSRHPPNDATPSADRVGWTVCSGRFPWAARPVGSAYTRAHGRSPRDRSMKFAHVRERHAPAGAPWRLVAAEPGPGSTGDPDRWIDLEVARRRAIAADGNLAHDRVLHRQPVTTLDDHLARGLRVAALTELVEGFVARDGDDDAVLDGADLAFGPPIQRPPSLRDFYAFEGHVRTMWERRGGEVPETWYRLPIFYFSNVSEIRGPDEPVWSPAASVELDYELEVAALVDTPVLDLPEERGEE